ncbi:MAG: aminotransferase class I/II-fold pyridoxal phosphate-dependent enzyme [Flavobacteriales bacterium]|nr:aminotransferase class I/II-fold pyridoxal phosphate-dependent enzyme [Flavobacteriales bacterium]
MIVDLRSDTVTQATKEMKEAMLMAEVGDDVLGDDPSVIALENLVAKRFGHESGLFCPSGTMTNQIAIKVHTNAPGEVICDELAHIYRYEGGGMAFNSGVSNRLIQGDRGRFTLEQLKAEINPDDIHFPPTQLVSLENTCNKAGGCYWSLSELERISNFCKNEGLPLHLDGARIYNALVAQNTSEAKMGKFFDSISLCLSKGLGAPVGSVLTGTADFIKKARRIRKIFGGGMRQAGYIAAAGIYALNHHVERLAIDHKNAKELGQLLKQKPYVKDIKPVDTNIVIFQLNTDVSMQDFIANLDNKGIRVVSMGPQTIRLVTHLDIGDQEMDKLKKEL